ncbi:hypothetical protein QZH41_010835 [Actinostola sp. cb2023]|nr:hypothetical protein QZH41_010835 [Actinostola sp. cb2023]
MASSDGDIFVPDFPDFDISDILLDLELPTCSTSATVPSTTTTVVTEDGNCSKRGNKRNIRAISDIELAKRNEARVPEGTKWSTSWCVRTWIEWAEERTETNTTSTSDLYKVANPDILNLSSEELNYWLRVVFVLAIFNPGLALTHFRTTGPSCTRSTWRNVQNLHCMEKNMFYLTPRRKCSDGDKRGPVPFIAGFVFKEYFTNHSLRATTATRGLEPKTRSREVYNGTNWAQGPKIIAEIPTAKHRRKNSYF